MQSFELFKNLSPRLANEIFEYLLSQDKASYKSALHTLAGQRKLRPVFVERKPKPMRHVWMRDAIAKPQNDTIAANLIQIWLINAKAPMLADFLDSLKIPHDGKGGIDSLPESPDKETLRTAIQGMIERYPKEDVLVYLHSFQSMDIANWAPLAELLDTEFVFDTAETAST